jgi:hypothetical protein
MRGRPSLKTITDEELLRRLSDLLKQSRHCEADLIAHIAEVDARKLYAREAAPSMFAYCTERLHLSESEAYFRIGAARASRRHPVLLAMLADGRLHLSGIERLAPHLTQKNCASLLGRAVHKTKRQIEDLVANVAPRLAAPPTMRRLPARRGSAMAGGLAVGSELRAAEVTEATAARHEAGVAHPGPCPTGAVQSDDELRLDGVSTVCGNSRLRRAVVEPVGPARFRVRFDASAELRDKLERLQALMRSSVPDGDLAKIIDAAVTEKLERLEAKRFAKVKKPRKSLAETDTTPRSRGIPAAVRRTVYQRDGGRCTYRDPHGRRCAKRHDLEFHHYGTPFGKQGDHSPQNIRLMCKSHNALRAEEEYGKEVMARLRRMAKRVSARNPGRFQPRSGRTNGAPVVPARSSARRRAVLGSPAGRRRSVRPRAPVPRRATSRSAANGRHRRRSAHSGRAASAAFKVFGVLAVAAPVTSEQPRRSVISGERLGGPSGSSQVHASGACRS